MGYLRFCDHSCGNTVQVWCSVTRFLYQSVSKLESFLIYFMIPTWSWKVLVVFILSQCTYLGSTMHHIILLIVFLLCHFKVADHSFNYQLWDDLQYIRWGCAVHQKVSNEVFNTPMRPPRYLRLHGANEIPYLQHSNLLISNLVYWN